MFGKIIALNEDRTGWILSDDGGSKYFFHLMSVHWKSPPIAAGDPVMFDRASGYTEDFATNIWKVEAGGLWTVVRDQTKEHLIPDLDEDKPKWPIYSTMPQLEEFYKHRQRKED